MFVILCLLAGAVVTGANHEMDESVDETCALQLAHRSQALISNVEQCEVGAEEICPGSAAQCAGDQCCPPSKYGATFPCPSAAANFAGCESNVKQRNCLARACCLAETAECLACQAGMPVLEYCLEHPTTEFCPPPKPCCTAMTAECLACTKGTTVAEYCRQHPETEFCHVGPGLGSAAPALLSVEVCQVGDHVACPGSGNMCAGDQCCPRSDYGATFPCPSASANFTGCESNVKQSNCLATACCLAETAECLACQAGMTVTEYCLENPTTEFCPAPQACCLAETAECLACQNNMTVTDYCRENPTTEFCPVELVSEPAALISSMEVCQVGAEEICPGSAAQCAGDQCCPPSKYGATFPCPSASANFAGCESKVKQRNCLARACCLAETAECLACQAGMPVLEYCLENPTTEFCPPPKPCCKAMTAECLACTKGTTVAEYCRQHPATEFCHV